MSHTMHRAPEERVARPSYKRERVADWNEFALDDDLTDVPDLFPTPKHRPVTSPGDGGAFHRAECPDCGTVLRVFITLAEAQAFCDQHREES